MSKVLKTAVDFISNALIKVSFDAFDVFLLQINFFAFSVNQNAAHAHRRGFVIPSRTENSGLHDGHF